MTFQVVLPHLQFIIVFLAPLAFPAPSLMLLQLLFVELFA